MVRVLLTGAAGQLGTDIIRVADTRDDIELHPFDRSGLNLSDAALVAGTIADVDPDVIIHAAAYTAVDDCESNEKLAYAINEAGTSVIVQGAIGTNARVIYISTDYVFDGAKTGPYIETDQPNPVSVYGKTKLAGEKAVRELGDAGLTIRTSWVCGANGSNMVKTILRLAQVHDTLTFVDDQIGKPTFTSDLAETLLTLATRNDSGLMHVTNEGVVSWYEFCREVLLAAGEDPERARPCSTQELLPPRPAPRPANSVLDNARFDSLGLGPLRDFREPLAEAVREILHDTHE